MSKRLSYVLRHAPTSVGLQLDPAGWVDVDSLLTALETHGTILSRQELVALVARSDKQRFALDATGTRIRASQGHSVPVELGYEPTAPPDALFHGTSPAILPRIRQEGLRRGGRHAVHLSPDRATARVVGQRRGAYVVLQVDASAMAAEGFEFTRSANGVWLVAHVPPRFLVGVGS